VSTLEGLRLAAQWQGAFLSGEGGGLLLVERVREHRDPRLALLAPAPEALAPALKAWAASEVPLSLVGLVPLPGADLGQVLRREARRIGALVGALDLGLRSLGEAPHLVRRLPGRLDPTPAGLAPLPLTSLQAFDLRRYLGELPAWALGEDLWWEGPAPAGCRVLVAPLELPTATPLTEALRAALRAQARGPVDFLPQPGDPAPLHALRELTPAATAFPAEGAAWDEALRRLAVLPAPAHFCGRC